jgi:NifU-like protein
MGLQQLKQSFPWSRYSKKAISKIDNPQSFGIFNKEESEARCMFLARGSEGTVAAGNIVELYWLVDKDDGIIVDARYQVFGQTALIAAAEAACELLVGKNYDQASRISADLIDRQVRDRPDESAFPRETFPHMNLVLGAIEQAAAQCTFIPIATSYTAPPVPKDMGASTGYPGWIDLPREKKISIIEDVLDSDVRPYIALDAGGVNVLNLVDDREVVISYSGSCTSCYSSVGTTLSYIQQTLRNKVDSGIVVTPDLEGHFK